MSAHDNCRTNATSVTVGVHQAYFSVSLPCHVRGHGCHPSLWSTRKTPVFLVPQIPRGFVMV
jgi:hypothetical protein